MNVDTAIDRTNWAETPIGELLSVADALQEERDLALARYRRVEAEVFRRMAQSDASILRDGDLTAERVVTKAYRWDADVIAELAPDHVTYVPERVIPGHYEARNTTALNNYIAKLGATPEADRLRAARAIEERNAKLVFTRQMSAAELGAQLTESVAKAARVKALVAKLEGGG